MIKRNKLCVDINRTAYKRNSIILYNLSRNIITVKIRNLLKFYYT